MPITVGTTYFVNEDFNAVADGTVITSVSGWIRQPVLAAPSTDGVVTGGRLRATSISASVYQSTVTPATADYEVSTWIDIRSKDTQTIQNGPAGRMSASADTYYYARYTEGATPGFSLFKRVAGTATQLGSTFTNTLWDGQWVKLTLSMQGSTIKMIVNATERVSVTDSAITAAGKAGVRMAGVVGVEQYGQIDRVVAKAL
jgi:hypothetical protein